MIRNIHKSTQRGFTLVELLTVLGIGTLATVGAFPELLLQTQESVDADIAQQIEYYDEAYIKFRANERRDPVDMNELINSQYFKGAADLPNGAQIVGASDGSKWNWNITTNSAQQAKSVAEKLGGMNAENAGTLVSLDTPVPTLETVEDQFLCRRNVPGAPDCNQMQTALDMNGNDIANAGNLQAEIGNFETVNIEEASIENLNTLETIQLGNNTITHDGDTLQFNAANNIFSGEVSIDGDLDLNNNNLENVNRLQVSALVADTITATDGTITNASGQSLDYDSGTIDNLTSQVFGSDTGDIDDLTAGSITTNTLSSTNWTSENVNTRNLEFTDATGGDLDLSGALNSASIEAQTSSLGSATADSLNVSGDIKGTNGLFKSINVNGNVSGENFSGTDFQTAQGSVNSNRQYADSLSIDVTENRSEIESNTQHLNANTQSIEQNNQGLRQNASDLDATDRRIEDNRLSLVANDRALSTNDQNIKGNESSLNQAHSELAANDNRINGNTRTIQNQAGQINNQSNQIASNDVDIRNNRNFMDENYGRILNNDQRIAGNRETLNSHGSRLNTVESKVSTNANNIQGNRNTLNSHANTLQNHNSRINTNYNLGQSNSSKITQNRNKANTNASNIATNSQGISNNRGDINYWSGRTRANTNAIQSNDVDIANNASKNADNKKGVDGNKSYIDSNRYRIRLNGEEIARQDVRLNTLEHNYSRHETRISDNTRSIGTVQNNIASLQRQWEACRAQGGCQ